MTKLPNEQTDVWDFSFGICLEQLEIRAIRNFPHRAWRDAGDGVLFVERSSELLV
jgi:hypothetical protein